MQVEILYETPHLLVVNKPAGLVVHHDGKTQEPALTDWLLEKYPEIKGVGEPFVKSDGTVIDRPGIVHRLDRETSGVLVVAKDQETFLWLKHQFQTRLVKKTYNAFVYGVPKEPDGYIDKPIGRSPTDFRRFSAQPGARGEMRDALTQYKVLEHSKEYSFLEIVPKTGRTHQIRVHLKALQRPVVCDKLYAPTFPQALGFKRLALHARKLKLSAPSGEQIEVEAPLPGDFEQALKELRSSKQADS
jgi:23S rRNA pseudouridine1911/1915/1917 synthase